MPHQQGVQSHIHYALRCQRPIGKPLPSHQCSHRARHQHGRDARLRLLLHHHVLEEEGSLGGSQTGEENVDERQAAQRHQPCVVIESGYQRGAEEQHHIKTAAHDDIEPKDGVIVVGGGLLEISYRRSKTTVLQGNGNEGEHVDHRHHAKVCLGQQTTEHDAEYQADDLHRPVVHRPPEETLRRLFL